MNEPYNETQLLEKAKSLASKYKGNKTDDLIGEAVLAYYEGVNKGITDEGALVTRMRKAMYAFSRYKSHPLTIPNSGNTYVLSKKLTDKQREKLTPAQKHLYDVLNVYSFDNEETLFFIEDCNSNTEASTILLDAMVKNLSDREIKVLTSVVLEGKTYSEVAEDFGTSKQNIYRILTNAKEKLKEALL